MTKNFRNDDFNANHSNIPKLFFGAFLKFFIGQNILLCQIWLNLQKILGSLKGVFAPTPPKPQYSKIIFVFLNILFGQNILLILAFKKFGNQEFSRANTSLFPKTCFFDFLTFLMSKIPFGEFGIN